MYTCDNCGHRCPEFEVAFPDIPDLLERINPGERVPAGECPECGALVHTEERPQRTALCVVSNCVGAIDSAPVAKMPDGWTLQDALYSLHHAPYHSSLPEYVAHLLLAMRLGEKYTFPATMILPGELRPGIAQLTLELRDLD